MSVFLPEDCSIPFACLGRGEKEPRDIYWVVHYLYELILPKSLYREDYFCLEIYLDKPPERGGSHAEWVRLWLPNAEVRLDSSLPLTPHIQFITHSVGFTFTIHPQTRSFSLLPTLPGCSSCPHLSLGPLQSHFSTSMIAPTIYSLHVLKAHS